MTPTTPPAGDAALMERAARYAAVEDLVEMPARRLVAELLAALQRAHTERDALWEEDLEDMQSWKRRARKAEAENRRLKAKLARLTQEGR